MATISLNNTGEMFSIFIAALWEKLLKKKNFQLWWLCYYISILILGFRNLTKIVTFVLFFGPKSLMFFTQIFHLSLPTRLEIVLWLPVIFLNSILINITLLLSCSPDFIYLNAEVEITWIFLNILASLLSLKFLRTLEKIVKHSLTQIWSII